MIAPTVALAVLMAQQSSPPSARDELIAIQGIRNCEGVRAFDRRYPQTRHADQLRTYRVRYCPVVPPRIAQAPTPAPRPPARGQPRTPAAPPQVPAAAAAPLAPERCRWKVGTTTGRWTLECRDATEQWIRTPTGLRPTDVRNALAGDMSALRQLGVFYRDQTPPIGNPVLARQNFQSCESANTDCAYEVALYYHYGSGGLTRDFAEARIRFHRVAQSEISLSGGSQGAAFQAMGMYCEIGLGGARGLDGAIVWYNRAASAGDDVAALLASAQASVAARDRAEPELRAPQTARPKMEGPLRLLPPPPPTDCPVTVNRR